jgi:hypothetical protein
VESGNSYSEKEEETNVCVEMDCWQKVEKCPITLLIGENFCQQRKSLPRLDRDNFFPSVPYYFKFSAQDENQKPAKLLLRGRES